MHLLKFNFLLLTIVFLVTVITACSGQPEPISYGHDECDFCKMQITDNRYGSEIVSDKGKIYKFDEVGCMVNFALVENLLGNSNNKFLVTVFSIPETFTDAPTAHFVKNDGYRSPMGLNVMAFDRESDADDFIVENEGILLNWFEVIELVKQRSM